MRKLPRSVPPRRNQPGKVFLNIPYDADFQELYLAYVAGLTSLGYTPRATLEIPAGTRRLDRIINLIQECDFSIHDLSRVQLDGRHPRVPRFNMPFELGLALAWGRFARAKHRWFVFEEKQHRLAKSLSDLNGTDPLIHAGTVGGVFSELSNAFIRPGNQPTVPQMRSIYRTLQKEVPAILTSTGSQSLYTASAFKYLCVVSAKAAENYVGIPA